MTAFLLLCQLLATGQESYFANTRKMAIAEGLLGQQVNCIYTSEDGAWIGTQAGLNHFDGFRFRHWTQSEGGLTRNRIHHILPDKDGIIWIFSCKHWRSTRDIQSIDLIHLDSSQAYSFENSIGLSAPFQQEDIQHFFGDASHYLYFYAKDQLWRYDGQKQFTKIPHPKEFLPSNALHSGQIVGRVDSTLAWIQADGSVKTDPGIPIRNFVFRAYGDSSYFWIDQRENDIVQYIAPNYPARRQNIPTQYGQRVSYDPYRQNYIYTFDDTLAIYNRRGELAYRYKPKNVVRALTVDRFGTFWLGTAYGLVLLRIEPQRFTRYLHTSSANKRMANSYRCRGIYELDNTLLVNTYFGRRAIDLKSGKVSAPDSIYQNPSFQWIDFPILRGKEGHFWTANAGVKKWDKGYGRQIQYTLLDSLVYPEAKMPRVWSMHEDVQGRIWMGTMEGLYYLEDGKLHRFEAYNGFNLLKKSTIMGIQEDQERNIWLSSNSGLYQLDVQTGVVARYSKKGQGALYLPSYDFQFLHQDKAGIYWLGTAENGMIRWDRSRGEIRQFNRKDGFPSNNIYAIQEDAFGFLWMSSNNGLIRFNKKDFSFQSFFEKDGISFNEFNRISYHQAQDGRMYFGGQNGITAFYPEDFLVDPKREKTAQLRIEKYQYVEIQEPKVQTEQQRILDGQQLQLSPSVRFVNFKVDLPDKFWSDQIQLVYQVETLDASGHNRDLNGKYVSPDNTVQLFGLLPGRYRLHIRTLHRQGSPVAQPLTFDILIPLPWYRQIWFILLCVLLAMAMIWAVLKWRTATLRKRQLELEAMVEERTRQILKDQQLIEEQAMQIQQMTDQLNQKDQRWLSHLEQTVQHKLGNINLDLSEIISDMGTSRSAFYEKVKELTQMTPNQYLQEARLQKARNLLEQRQCETVKEVALSVGIRKPSYFSKLYKERFGKLPSTYF
ncbi:MAG: two-component regulator propeller domain-containing protein [Bacteroidota bacterium]